MKKATLYLLIFFFFECMIMHAQQPVLKGTLIDLKDDKPNPITFKQEPNQNDNSTKYTIVQDGSEIYEVNFSYYAEVDSIAIRFYDKRDGTLNSRYVKFNSHFDSHIIVKNYLLNQTPVNDHENHAILFSMDDNNFITLYQFRAVANPQKLFILQYIPSPVMEKHNTAVGTYRQYKNMLDEQDTAISVLKRSMFNYRDSVLHTIDQQEEVKKMTTNPKDADAAMQQDFNRLMDGVFINYFKNVYPYSNEQFEVIFNFSCKGNGKITVDTIRNMNFTSSGQRNWLRDSFILKIKPVIEAGEYASFVESESYPNLGSDLRVRFRDYTTLYGPSFEPTFKQLDSSFDWYRDRNVHIPTRYFYRFKFKSETRNPSWKYTVSLDGSIKFIDQSSTPEQVERTPALERLFIDKIADPETKKYNLQVCTIYINDKPMGQDIRKKPN